MNSIIRIGTRGSKLALWQTHWVIGELKKIDSKLEFRLVPIKTTGDHLTDVALAKIGGKALFLKEIEEALLNKEIDLAVHSMKDVPTKLPHGLKIGAILKRENPYDALISNNGLSFESLPAQAVVGSSSLRRICQLKKIRPNLQYKDIRGNVDTRLAKLKKGEFDAIVLAVAGLKRLGFEQEMTQILDLVPSVGQGAVGVEMRGDDTKLEKLISPLNDLDTLVCVEAERVFLDKLQGGCQVPIGCYAKIENDMVLIEAFISDLEAKRLIQKSIHATKNEAKSQAKKLAEEMLADGGKEILKEIFN